MRFLMGPGYCLRRTPPPHPPGGWVGGWVTGQKKGGVPKNRPQIPGLSDRLHFLTEEHFSDVGEWIGWRGLARVPNNPPPRGRPQAIAWMGRGGAWERIGGGGGWFESGHLADAHLQSPPHCSAVPRLPRCSIRAEGPFLFDLSDVLVIIFVLL